MRRTHIKTALNTKSICEAQGHSWIPQIAGYLFEYVEIELTRRINSKKELLSKKRNLINIELQHTEELSDSHDSGLNTSESRSLNNEKTIVYNEHALRTIGQLVQHDQRLRILPFGTISAVRKLKLNHKPIKKKCQQRTPLPS